MAGKLKSRQRKVKMKGVTLCGRREGTLRVLTNSEYTYPLPYDSPAIGRYFTRSTNTVSLSTLYSRCEPRIIPSKAQPNPPSGALLVVKDSFDGMFGAWIGEGIMKG
ncbi:hypothetical protein EDD17DRAFT_716284 [Pisolithus thermaeus]|nr:hypothetical protein EDD17DRAFT_716284 [Pisolithus thermaeus]